MKIDIYLNRRKSTESRKMIKQIKQNSNKDVMLTITINKCESHFKTLLN